MNFTEDKSYKVQLLRGVSIIAVVFIHCTPPGIAEIWFRPFFNFSVGCFLFLSGLLSDAKKWHPIKRIKKILIPYVVWTFLIVVAKNYAFPFQIPIIFFQKLITGRAAAVMYFVFIYCELTLLIPLIDRLARSRYRWIGFLISPVEIIIMRLMPIALGYRNSEDVIVLNLSCLGWFIYFYLGYLIGNKFIQLKIPKRVCAMMWGGTIILQILEGYWYYRMGAEDCGSQLKLSAVFSGVLFNLLAYHFIETDNMIIGKYKTLYRIGDCSFGIFFSHLAVREIVCHIPYMSRAMIFPLDAMITIILSCACVLISRRPLGEYSRFLGF